MKVPHSPTWDTAILTPAQSSSTGAAAAPASPHSPSAGAAHRRRRLPAEVGRGAGPAGSPAFPKPSRPPHGSPERRQRKRSSLWMHPRGRVSGALPPARPGRCRSTSGRRRSVAGRGNPAPRERNYGSRSEPAPPPGPTPAPSPRVLAYVSTQEDGCCC